MIRLHCVCCIHFTNGAKIVAHHRVTSLAYLTVFVDFKHRQKGIAFHFCTSVRSHTVVSTHRVHVMAFMTGIEHLTTREKLTTSPLIVSARPFLRRFLLLSFSILQRYATQCHSPNYPTHDRTKSTRAVNRFIIIHFK